MTTINLLLVFHGITPDNNPTVGQIEKENYGVMKDGINKCFAKLDKKSGPAKNAQFTDETIFPVYWGFNRDNTLLLNVFKEENELTKAENVAAALCPDDRSLGDKIETPLGSFIANQLKDKILRLGLADAVFYASSEGEFQVRWSVFSQIFDRLFSLLSDNKEMRVKLHFVSHSLGVTVAHDLAYLIFNFKGNYTNASFFTPPSSLSLKPEQTNKLDFFKAKLNDDSISSRILFGSFNGMEGQLPLFVFRAMSNVQSLSENKAPFDATKIGVNTELDRVQLQFQYVPNDLLGFSALGLYKGGKEGRWGKDIAIHPFWRQSGYGVFGLAGFHTMCWASTEFQENIAKVIYENW